MTAKILSVKKGSIADELGIKKGDELLSIDNTVLKDYIEYQFYNASDELEIEIKKKNGDIEVFEIEKDFDEDLGLIFESLVFDKIRPCANHCIFCFVDQQPKGLRDTLYIKDDDYRLSYLQGTYITLTNLTNRDRERIAREHLGPLFISVHTTNPELREKMLRSKNARKINEELDFLNKNDIPFNCQIVLCPTYNDGNELKKTLSDLSKYENLLSVAVVPFGVTKFREEKVKEVDEKIAKETIKIVDSFNKKQKRQLAFCSDEFYQKAKLEIPEREYYGDFAQLDDGVGAIRLILDDFEKRFKKLPKKLNTKKEIIFANSSSVADIFRGFCARLNKIENISAKVIEVKSTFWGDSINIAGLITAQDLIKTLKGKTKGKTVIIPSVLLQKYTKKFLDGKTLKEVEEELNCKFLVIKDNYSTKELFAYLKK
ncbi:DUF512 domain-containing protein [bacterium]|nr:DUF512 domain-containing protein [bacterium]